MWLSSQVDFSAVEGGMAARNPIAVPQQQRVGGAALPPTSKQQKPAGAEGNRKVLGDIGNLVKPPLPAVEGKPVPQITRPVTRSYGAQLLRTEEAEAAKQKQTKTEKVDGGGGVDGKNKQKVTINPKPEKAVIVISPDTPSKSKKKVHSLTYVLTARSKYASCGMTDSPEQLVQNIDGADAGDQLAVADYVEDIYKYYKLVENSYRLRDYMDLQPEINARMRAILADWLIEVHSKFDLLPETLYLTFYVMDKYLSMKVVLKRELQLVGATAMLIACKYEEIWAPEVNDFVCLSDRAYSREQILNTETEILDKLEWNLTVPTPYVFLLRYLKASLFHAKEVMKHMVFYYAELGLMQYSIIAYSPSMLAASAVYAARRTLAASPPWTETLKCHTGFSEEQLQECAGILVSSRLAAPKSDLKVVYRKYASCKRGAVALLPPAVNPPALMHLDSGGSGLL